MGRGLVAAVRATVDGVAVASRTGVGFFVQRWNWTVGWTSATVAGSVTVKVGKIDGGNYSRAG